VPRLVPDLEILPWCHTHVLAVHVYPGPGRPCCLKREGIEQGVYVRVGSTNRRADNELIEELRRFSRNEPFDEQAFAAADSEAIDFRAASESFAPVRRLQKADLVTLRLVATHQGREVATVGGLLLFGKDRERYFPDAWIQAGRSRGTDKSVIVDRTERSARYAIGGIVSEGRARRPNEFTAAGSPRCSPAEVSPNRAPTFQLTEAKPRNQPNPSVAISRTSTLQSAAREGFHLHDALSKITQHGE
jgi:hypothetical protein